MKIKNLISFLIIFGVIAIASQTVSAQFTRNTNRINSTPSCDQLRLTPIKCGYYLEGFQDAVTDTRNRRSNNYRRYQSKYNRQYETFYRNGYEAGMKSSGGSTANNWTDDQKDAYEKGYDFGDDDRDRRISRLPRRYEGRYDRRYERFYTLGYNDGYDQKPKYSSTINPNPNRLPFPNRGNRGNRRGTATGTATWNGRVDNRVRVILQGNEIRTQSVAGRLSGVYNNMQGVLPRNATISVRKLDGRGTVRIIQQPNRANRGVAIVEIFDAKRSDDNYNLQITWQRANRQEAYSPGKLYWRGDVDGTVEIRISGDFVESIDKTASGLNIERSNLEGYLAERNGTVRVVKKDGRGTVTVVEQPNRNNDYTAVIRIFDPQGSDDEYEIEVTW